ncbi:Coenzyme Q-binding protein COQ10-like, mitochondrial [Hondaea fermentalgiana]|uniref:Coenzyme Q-binding protein COQ10-like, mitochondrial n=1 Tax=Hondaea fermentalgiana TaxID=2315210 RepID=A0A2R5GVZ8_9STRA|nr:Coenzyme Q-binding protein COQ10-like, mitochondrial [Hondaea fermentalgiana]|eukprot:GBG34745.1 Coenzyme Q-binding protein COQ10-like, mitochondrial [Hondaea fermentalgiana]
MLAARARARGLGASRKRVLAHSGCGVGQPGASPGRFRSYGEALRTVAVQRELPFDRLDVFKVVVDVVKYPEFLPYCTEASMTSFGNQQMRAEVVFAHKLFQERMQYEISWKSPEMVLSVATDTKFAKRIEYLWHFEETKPHRTLVDVELKVAFTSSSSAFLFDMFADRIQDRVFQAFAGRIRELARLSKERESTV